MDQCKYANASYWDGRGRDFPFSASVLTSARFFVALRGDCVPGSVARFFVALRGALWSPALYGPWHDPYGCNQSYNVTRRISLVSIVTAAGGCGRGAAGWPAWVRRK